jgi:hypothetical protein
MKGALETTRGWILEYSLRACTTFLHLIIKLVGCSYRQPSEHPSFTRCDYSVNFGTQILNPKRQEAEVVTVDSDVEFQEMVEDNLSKHNRRDKS